MKRKLYSKAEKKNVSMSDHAKTIPARLLFPDRGSPNTTEYAPTTFSKPCWIFLT